MTEETRILCETDFDPEAAWREVERLYRLRDAAYKLEADVEHRFLVGKNKLKKADVEHRARRSQIATDRAYAAYDAYFRACREHNVQFHTVTRDAFGRKIYESIEAVC